MIVLVVICMVNASSDSERIQSPPKAMAHRFRPNRPRGLSRGRGPFRPERG
jgi:hypothetical protein